MGIFSRKKTYVAATTLNIIEDTPDLLTQSVNSSIIKGRQIAPDIVGNYLNGLWVSSKRYYNYAKRNYTYGLPQGHRGVIKTQDYIVEEVIATDVGQEVTLLSHVVDTCDSDYFAYGWLLSNRGWIESTDEVTNPPTPPAGHTGETIYFFSSKPLGINNLEITYVYTKSSNNYYFTENIAVNGMYPNEYYYHAVWVPKDKTTPINYWNYRISSGTYPKLALNGEQSLNSTYFPVVPLRINNQDLITNVDNDFSRTAKFMLNIMGVKLESLVESLNENPDITDVDHAYIISGVSLDTDKQQSLRYLHDYFVYLHGLNPWAKSAYTNWSTNHNTYNTMTKAPTVEVIRIEDASYKIELSYLYTEQNILSGSIGKIGFCNSSHNISSVGTSGSFNYERSSVTYRRQLTANTYSEITIYGLKHVNYIYGSLTIDTTIEEAFNDTDNGNFVIPLNFEIVEAMGLTNATELMYDTLKIVFNSTETVKLKWYQTKLFQLAITVIAIAITIVTYQPGALTASVVGASSVIGLTTIQLVMADIVLAFAINGVTNYILESLPPRIAFAFALAQAAYSIDRLFAAGGSIKGLPFAIELLAVTNKVVAAAINTAAVELQDKITEFEEYKAEAVAELEAKFEELQPQRDLDPLDLFVSFGEESYFQRPDDYYFQAIHAGNVGTYSLDSVHSYVDNTLTLPSLSNDIGPKLYL